jgi:hypothetical protein
VSAPDHDDLESDELVARAGDLVEKIERDIEEGAYPPWTALPALIDVVVLQLLASDDPEGKFRLFLADLLDQFHSVLNMLDDDAPAP